MRGGGREGEGIVREVAGGAEEATHRNPVKPSLDVRPVGTPARGDASSMTICTRSSCSALAVHKVRAIALERVGEGGTRDGTRGPCAASKCSRVLGAHALPHPSPLLARHRSLPCATPVCAACPSAHR
ncbi:uncharacterized protein SCHCODRAFT_02557922 [Schizophyllum commune H4-8]|uniref:uncharacterized protein n=1 Tax=Schizophyllum commune (strain H4-8 / FGSC 9210) TaxID=578458 RepID=UPI00215FF310|nr:uncharacterized protein SCHCODRAFT_02557922 [Schizophyllum commune H4-8]KAI5885001.1 hypothetical protein SCHCODRAFT_02557922 [Schizophyllum commune H4-8]